MLRNAFWKTLPPRVLLGVLVMLLYAPPGAAIFGIWRRHFRRAAIVVGTTAVVAGSAAAASNAAASQNAAAAHSAAAAQSAAAASQSAAASAAAASQSAAAASKASVTPAAPQKTPQQQLQELESLYKQGLITQSEYEKAKQKIIDQLTK